eukprot:m.294744 g.294744  ORF g.294744 m.294744 type:complete len:223 (-) comp16259_c1_seq6:4726-5394(-)
MTRGGAGAAASDAKAAAPPPDFWNCTSCTFQNPRSAAKCSVCLTAKASSSRRKSQMKKVEEVQQQQQQELLRLQYEAAARLATPKATRTSSAEGHSVGSPGAQTSRTSSAKKGRSRKVEVALPRGHDTQEMIIYLRGLKCKIRASRSVRSTLNNPCGFRDDIQSSGLNILFICRRALNSDITSCRQQHFTFTCHSAPRPTYSYKLCQRFLPAFWREVYCLPV